MRSRRNALAQFVRLSATIPGAAIESVDDGILLLAKDLKPAGRQIDGATPFAAIRRDKHVFCSVAQAFLTARRRGRESSDKRTRGS